jgi:hypothetical protein
MGEFGLNRAATPRASPFEAHSDVLIGDDLDNVLEGGFGNEVQASREDSNLPRRHDVGVRHVCRDFAGGD